MACWSKSSGAEGLQSFPFLLCGTAKRSVPLHAGVLGGSPLLDVGTWSCLWERRSQKAQAAHGGKVAEIAAIPSARRQDLMKKDSVISLLLGSRVGAERPELGITHGRGSLGRAVHIELDFPPGSAHLAAPGSRSLAADQAVAPGAGRAGCLPPGLPRLGTGFSLGKPLLPRSLCVLTGKLKFLGKTCRFCRKSSFG